MAFSSLSPAEVARQFESVKWTVSPTEDDYLAEIAACRTRSWALDEGRLFSGVSTVAPPVLDHRERWAFCMTATMFSGQHDHLAPVKIGEELQATGAWLARRLHLGPGGQHRETSSAV